MHSRSDFDLYDWALELLRCIVLYCCIVIK